MYLVSAHSFFQYILNEFFQYILSGFLLTVIMGRKNICFQLISERFVFSDCSFIFTVYFEWISAIPQLLKGINSSERVYIYYRKNNLTNKNINFSFVYIFIALKISSPANYFILHTNWHLHHDVVFPQWSEWNKDKTIYIHQIIIYVSWRLNKISILNELTFVKNVHEYLRSI